MASAAECDVIFDNVRKTSQTFVKLLLLLRFRGTIGVRSTAMSVSVGLCGCLSVHLRLHSLYNHILSKFRGIFCTLPVAVARSSSDVM